MPYIYMKLLKIPTRDLLLSYILPVLLIALPALVYVCYRAANLSFTHDESLSFFTANGDPSFAEAPNNHWLNTAFMRIFGSLFGNSEFVLRLPNIIAFILYCLAGLSIIKSLKRPGFSIFLFIILVLNTLMLEFFGLARGYGISLGMLMLSFCFLFKLDNKTLSVKSFVTFLVLTLMFSQFALYANFNSFNVHLAMLPVLLFSVIHFGRLNITKQNKKSVLILFVSIFVIDFAALIPAFVRLKLMQSTNELAVFGDHNGFWQTTVKSLITGFYFHELDFPTTFNVLLMVVAGIFIFACMWFVRNVYYKDYSNFTRIFFILLLLILAPVLQEVIFNIPYPVSRTAIFYYPVFSLVFIFLFAALFKAAKHILIKASLVILLCIVSAFVVYASFTKRNFTNTTEWYYDWHDKDMLELIDKDRISNNNQDSVMISNFWIFTPAINYYRVTRNYTWLKPVIKEDYKKADYYICLSGDITKIPADSLQLMAKYDEIGVSLYKELRP